MRRIVSVLAVMVVVAAMVAVMAMPAFAQDVPPHQHFVVTPDGDRVAVGPDACGNPNAQEGFNHFHGNVHVGTPNLEAFEQENNPVGFAAVRGCP